MQKGNESIYIYIYIIYIYVNETIFKGFHADRLESRDSITVARIIFLSVLYITQQCCRSSQFYIVIRIQLIDRDPDSNLIFMEISNQEPDKDDDQDDPDPTGKNKYQGGSGSLKPCDL